jgi:hypothetical protein
MIALREYASRCCERDGDEAKPNLPAHQPLLQKTSHEPKLNASFKTDSAQLPQCGDLTADTCFFQFRPPMPAQTAAFAPRNVFALFTLPLLALLMTFAPVGTSKAEAGQYAAGYQHGLKVGRQHGYQDGYKNAYKKSYVRELMRPRSQGYASRRASPTSGEYIRGYRDGYEVGYQKGYKAGRRNGRHDGREYAHNWKVDLRAKMRRCMERGGYGCWAP